MLDERLPVQIDPIRYAETRRELAGPLALAKMARLGEALYDDAGEVQVRLHFGIDEEGFRYMRGTVSGELSLLCQRCMEPMAHHVELELSLAIVGNPTEAEALPSHYDPLMVGDQPLFLQDIIEDELLLALPIVPRHEEDCMVKVEQGSDETESGEPGAGNNPFAELAKLKTRGNA